jgi:hypothetical protein
MVDLARERCFNHEWREAAAKCLQCGRYYCRECIVEHEDRMVCAPCLVRLTAARAKRKARLSSLGRAGLCFIGILTAWLFFYLIGRGLLALPSSFHEGSIWRTSYWDTGRNGYDE